MFRVITIIEKNACDYFHTDYLMVVDNIEIQISSKTTSNIFFLLLLEICKTVSDLGLLKCGIYLKTDFAFVLLYILTFSHDATTLHTTDKGKIVFYSM